jgi:hypothetical protein
LYTGRKNVKLSGGSSCRKSNNGRNACSRNGKTTSSGTVITETLNSTPRIAADIAAIEKRKPSSRLPKGMRETMALWRSSAPNMNEAGVAKIIQTYYVFDGYWSKNDLKKLLNIVQNIRTRNNIKSNGEIGRKLNVLNGRIRGFLPNNGSPSRSGLKRTQSNVNNGGNAGTTPAPPTNNAAKRRANLNAYINNLQRQLDTKGNLKKSVYLSKLNKNNSNVSLANIKAEANANARRIASLAKIKAEAKANATNIQQRVKRGRTNRNTNSNQQRAKIPKT